MKSINDIVNENTIDDYIQSRIDKKTNSPEEYTKLEQLLLDELLKIDDKVKKDQLLNKYHNAIMQGIALRLNKALDRGLVTKEDEETDTSGCDLSELKTIEKPFRDDLEKDLLDRKDWDVRGHKSFLPMLFSEWILDKNNINYQ